MASIKPQLLKGIGDITERFGLGKTDFYTFLNLGMPVRRINGKWFGYADNIDDFFRQITIGEPVDVLTDNIPDDMKD